MYLELVEKPVKACILRFYLLSMYMPQQINYLVYGLVLEKCCMEVEYSFITYVEFSLSMEKIAQSMWYAAGLETSIPPALPHLYL